MLFLVILTKAIPTSVSRFPNYVPPVYNKLWKSAVAYCKHDLLPYCALYQEVSCWTLKDYVQPRV